MAKQQKPQQDVPVYLFTGFLESGKTKFIQETLEDPRFNSGEQTLLLLCEEGEEEYAPEKFATPHVVCRTIEDGEDALALLFVSSLPWLSYEAIVQPTPYPADSNPRLTWGKYRQEGERTVLPVSLLCHHALADGLHLARFYQCLEEELAQFPGDQP